ncbi:hypothetical protein DB88DRAFT_477947 [Papiliotrema laurentii]|uniref:NADH dehydrogenase, alpha subcomplex, subunit 6 n=1 Tax=Papiliotrema laurentii TaxID=5418 RepID=A0AAD9FWK9_PAPLA|nr:hypothetical protein DB88DRAFT_477947 [Papiliotrema laurentii]
MTTIPARLARTTLQSPTLEHARKRTIQAYREWYRAAPEIVSLYALSVPPSMVRLKIRQDFERNKYVDNLDVINMLLLKNQQEYQETMNGWKQEPHIMHWFKPYEEAPVPTTFLDKFYSGRDEPAATNPIQRSTGS